MENLSEQIFKIYDEAKNKILLCIRSAIQNDEQYKAIRKLVLDELGLSGAEGKIKHLLGTKDWAGKS